MPKTAATRKTGKPAKRRKARKPRATRLNKLPWWGALAGCLLVVAVYLALLYHFFVGPLSFRWRAMFGEPDYPQEYDIHGIDISHYQKGIDWPQLRNTKVNGRPLRFVIVKATEGLTLTDEDFNDNFYQARANGLIRGAYHFYIPGADPREQALFFLRQAHLEPGDIPPILDIERRGDLSPKALRQGVRTWLATVEQAYHVKPVIYTNLDFKRRHLTAPDLDAYPLWIANYYKKHLTYEGSWVMWQYTDMGTVEGISHKVDFDLFNGTMEDLQAFLIPSPARPQAD